MSLTDEAVRARIEILEELQQQRSGGGTFPGSTFAGPIVARETATSPGAGSTLEAVVAPDGEQVFVLTHRSIWTKRNGVAGTQGVPPLFPHEVIAALDGTGVFCRTPYSDPALRVGINDLFIDPANPAADDENDGLTALTPLATGYELFRRWGWGVGQPIVGPNLVTSPDGFTHIHVQSDLVSPDSLPLKITVARDGLLSIEAPLLPANIIRTGTLTNAVTAMNRAVPLGGTRLTVRDNTLATWALAEVPNRRVRMLDGPAVGGTFQAQTDAVATPGQVECSPCQTTNGAGFSFLPTTVTPAVGNTYVIERLVVVNLGELNIDEELNPSFGGYSMLVYFQNINIPSTGQQSWLPENRASASGMLFIFFQCTVDRNIDVSRAALVFNACYWSGGGPGGFVQVVGQAISVRQILVGGGASAFGGFLIFKMNATGIESVADFDFVANQCSMFTIVGAPIRNCASWNAPATAGLNAGGHGFLIGGGGVGVFFGTRGQCFFKATVWGNGNPGAGILVGAGCTGIGPPQNITGTQGDVKLANSSSTVGNNTYWQAATGLYVGATGAAGVASAASWALITAAKAAPGYGGSVHFPDQQASWVANESTA